ncbi:hypothetical protein ACOSQ3_003342 [Xanthoceras sorbifolium]
MFVKGKGKDEYLTTKAAILKETDAQYRTWKIENNTIMSWLINSMSTEIGENFLLYETANEIWEATKETYSNKNTSELVTNEEFLQDLRQGEHSVTKYYNLLLKHWQQLDAVKKYS